MQVAVYVHFRYDGEDNRPRFEYPKITLPFTNEQERQNALSEARVIIDAERIRNRQDYDEQDISYYIVEQTIVETL